MAPDVGKERALWTPPLQEDNSIQSRGRKPRASLTELVYTSETQEQMVLGWPQKCVQTLGSERGGPALGLAGLSENKDREDFETEGADPSLPVSLWIGEGFLIPTQRMCVLPHPPTPFNRRGEEIPRKKRGL